jgi:2-oxoglutarate ferredoxin oxidoreductase subunit gamma
VRGGTAHYMIIISDEEIASPFVNEPDYCVVMNEPSLDKFESKIKKGGVLFLNSSLINRKPKRKDIKIFKVPFTDIALKIGNIKVANIVALGNFIKETKVVSKNSVLAALQEIFAKKEIKALNEKALKESLNQL